MQVGSQTWLIHCLTSAVVRLDRPHRGSEAGPSESLPRRFRVVAEESNCVELGKHLHQLAKERAASHLLGCARFALRWSQVPRDGVPDEDAVDQTSVLSGQPQVLGQPVSEMGESPRGRGGAAARVASTDFPDHPNLSLSTSRCPSRARRSRTRPPLRGEHESNLAGTADAVERGRRRSVARPRAEQRRSRIRSPAPSTRYSAQGRPIRPDRGSGAVAPPATRRRQPTHALLQSLLQHA